MRPERLYLGKPAGEFASKESVGRISARPDLVGETAGGEERDLECSQSGCGVQLRNTNTYLVFAVWRLKGLRIALAKQTR